MAKDPNDLCMACLSYFWNASTTPYARSRDGKIQRQLTPGQNPQELIDILNEEMVVWTCYGDILAMFAVTTVDGFRLCNRHAWAVWVGEMKVGMGAGRR